MVRVLVIDDNQDMRELMQKSDDYLFTAREIGAQVVLAKPFDRDQLLRCIQQVLH